MARERNNRNDITERIIQEIRDLPLFRIPYNRVLEAIRQGADVSRLDELRFAKWGDDDWAGRNDPAINPLFMGAIMYGSDTLITEMLQHDINVENIRTDDGENVIHMLINRASGDTPTGDLLGAIQLIANTHPHLLTEKDNYDRTPLGRVIHLFARFNRTRADTRPLYAIFNYILEALEEQKEDIEQPTKRGVTNLMIAAANATPDVIHRLIQAGAKVDLADSDGDTALMHACRDVSIDNVLALLEHGADKDLQNKEGHTALRIAVEHGNYDIAQLLMQQGTPARMNLKGNNNRGIRNYANAALNNYNRNNRARENFLRTYSRSNRGNGNSNNEKKNNQQGGKGKKRKTRRIRKARK